MPIWADFMREALRIHPEWSGDWTMPAGIRKAEIDIRNGTLVRELDAVEGMGEPAKPAAASDRGGQEGDSADESESEGTPIYVTSVPAEFRRVELFIAGTVPNRMLVPTVEDALAGSDSDTRPSPTPLESTWQEGEQQQQSPEDENLQRLRRELQAEASGSVSVMICATTGLRATMACPSKQPRTFAAGSAPRDFCPFHR
jgi:hypothetical protein